MFSELFDYLKYKLKELAKSRLFPLAIAFSVMFAILIVNLYQLQIVEGEEAQESYVEQKTLRTITLSSTRGNIYDRNGVLLAYNELVYSVTMQDTGLTGYEKNLVILDLLEILDEHGESIVQELPLYVDSAGNITSSTEVGSTTWLRLLRDVYGKTSVDELYEDDDCDVDLDAQGLYDLLYDRYGVGDYSSSETDAYEVSVEDAIRIINIRWLLATTAYQQYMTVVVAEDVSDETMTEILEHADDLEGIDIEEDYQRVYTDSVYFSQIIGYTGIASTDELAELNEGYEDGEEPYSSGDVVGKTGIEAYMETELQGVKGSRTMYLNSVGQIMEVVSEVEPTTGNDVYLTIDYELQVGIYELVEQHLSGIIVSKLVNALVYNEYGASASERQLSIYEAYYQMINNNVLDMDDFSDAEEGTAQAEIYDLFLTGQASAISRVREELLSDNPTPYADLGYEIATNGDNFMQIYISNVYTILEDEGILLTDEIDTSDETYIAYKTDETISIQEFLQYALTQNWIDISQLDIGDKYTSSSETYEVLVDKICELIETNETFTKRVYKELIYTQVISGCQICMALLEQGVLDWDEEEYASLQSGTTVTAYNYLKGKIEDIEITPAQLAMYPCQAAVTVCDVNTGEVLACVSYPSYDNNMLSGSVDAEYYSSLVADQSSPLYNTATQAQKAPGSVFKLVTTAAALETGVVTADEIVATDSTFTKLGLSLSCASGVNHGSINIVTAITKSCNYFFAEMGYRLSLVNDEYSESTGLSILYSYAEQLGLTTTTGIELSELEPQVSDTSPIPSAIGQGTNLFSNVQLARYAATLANGGTVYELTLLDKLTDSSGTLIEEYGSTVVSTADFSDTTWDTIHEGMRSVATNSSSVTTSVEIAGKTGTAEESKQRPNHANFICYAPYDDPEIAVAVTILYGYSSSNSVSIASDVIDLYYGNLTLEEILENSATSSGEETDD